MELTAEVLLNCYLIMFYLSSPVLLNPPAEPHLKGEQIRPGRNHLFTGGLKKLRVRLYEEEPVGKEVANLKSLSPSYQAGQQLNTQDTGGENFQIFNSDPQSTFFQLNSRTGILTIAHRIDRDQLCTVFKSCCCQKDLENFVNLNNAASFSSGDSYSPENGYFQEQWSSNEGYLPSCRLTLNVRSDDQYSRIIVVHVHIVDLNDNSPTWSLPSGTSKLLPTTSVNKQILLVQVSEDALLEDSVSLNPAFDLDCNGNGVAGYVMYPKLQEFALLWTPELEFVTEEAETIHFTGLASDFEGKPFPGTHHIQKKSDMKPLNGARHDLRLVVKKLLDRETKAFYEFRLTAYDGGSPSRNASVTVRVEITDGNDNSPQFSKDTYEVELEENARPHTPVIQVSATDADSGLNGRVRYRFSSLTKPAFSKLFNLDPVTGWIHVQWEVDYEKYRKIVLTIEAMDGGSVSRSSTCIVEINVLDANDNAPELRFEPAHLTNYALVPENERPGRFVAVFTVTDRDSGENGRVICSLKDPLRWRIESDRPKEAKAMLANPFEALFRLQLMYVPFSLMYKLVTSAVFDRELISRIVVLITCADHGHPQRNTTGSVSVQITDANDEIPVLERSRYYFTVAEDTPVNTRVFTVNATDADEGENGQVIYHLYGADAHFFDLEPKTGEISIRTVLDREARDQLHFSIQVSDGGTPSLSSSADATVTVTDVNDNAPVLKELTEFSIFENHSVARPVGKLAVTDEDTGRNAEVSFLVLTCQSYPVGNEADLAQVGKAFTPTLLTQDEAIANEICNFFIAKDGRVYLGHTVLDREVHSVHELKVRVEDNGTPKLSSTGKILIHILDVNDNAPNFMFPSSSNNTIYVPRTARPGRVIGQLIATDSDLGDNGEVHYSMKVTHPSRENEMFSIDSVTGEVHLLKSIGGWYEQQQKHTPETKAKEATSGGSNNSNSRRAVDFKEERQATYLAGEMLDLQSQQSAHSVLVTAKDCGTPSLSTSAVLRILFSPPFYPLHKARPRQFTNPQSEDLNQTEEAEGHLDVLESSSLTSSSNDDESLESALLVNNSPLTGVGMLLTSILMVGLFSCLVLALVIVLLRRIRHQSGYEAEAIPPGPILQVTKSSPGAQKPGSDASPGETEVYPPPFPLIVSPDRSYYRQQNTQHVVVPNQLEQNLGYMTLNRFPVSLSSLRIHPDTV